MPQRRCAIKELRKSRTRRLRNLDVKTDMKKTVKRYLAALKEDNRDSARDLLKTVYKKLDKAVKRNVLHANTAARRKSRLSRLIASRS